MTSSRACPSRTGPARVRCAIYTRKSSEEGLEQSFNSLDAQREACEAYIMSQSGEGWSALPALYDDGGYSGGSMDRPALRQLLADIKLRKVDVVVVYKVDRLTRSLADFSRIVDVFDAHGASFVSVTQAFNTTSSMGRLTLNVLLSFAQFEREVTGERIRDKIAASKRKGMWMGGIPPLGYRAHERTLLVDEAEAVTVRHIFARYIALGSVHALKDELDHAGVRARASRRSTGEQGAPFCRGALYHLLSNRIYVGEIVHKDQTFPGRHIGIIEQTVFERAATVLAANRRERRTRTVAVGRAPLTGVLFDAEGRPLSPVASRNSRGRLYRYYISARLQQGGRRGDEATMRVPAPLIEGAVLERLTAAMPAVTDWTIARQVLIRVEVGPEAIQLLAEPRGRVVSGPWTDISITKMQDGRIALRAPFRLRSWKGRASVSDRVTARRGNGHPDASLVRGLVRAHQLVRKARAGAHLSIEDLSRAEGTSASYVRRLSRLAFLAPDIQEAILDGYQPSALNLERLMRLDLPINWDRQREALGFATT